jgi:ATP-dependent helicase/nuclease subunit A
MTRARDRLYVAGFEGLRPRPRGCWYDLIADGLESELEPGEDSFGQPVRRIACPQTAALPAAIRCEAAIAAEPLPDWAAALAPQEPEMQGGHVQPSRLAVRRPASPTATEAEAAAAAQAAEEALMRGRLVHRLLELLPALPPAQRQQAGARFLGIEAAALDAGQRVTLLGNVIAILEDPRFGAVFGPGSRAETAVAAEIPARDGGAPVVISGQIDRLIVTPGEIVALDFKTGAFVPARAELIPPAHIAQMAAYCLVLARLFPGKPVRAALLWTSAPRLMEIPAKALEEAGKHLPATPG